MKIADSPPLDASSFHCAQCSRSLPEVPDCPQRSFETCVYQVTSAAPSNTLLGHIIIWMLALGLTIGGILWVVVGNWGLGGPSLIVGVLLLGALLFNVGQKYVLVKDPASEAKWRILSGKVVSYSPGPILPAWGQNPPLPSRPLPYPAGVLTLYQPELHNLDQTPTPEQVAALLTNTILSLTSQGLIRLIRQPTYNRTLRSALLSQTPIGEYCMRLTKAAATTTPSGKLENEIIRLVKEWHYASAPHDNWHPGLRVDFLHNALFYHHIPNRSKLPSERYAHQRRRIIRYVMQEARDLRTSSQGVVEVKAESARGEVTQGDVAILLQLNAAFMATDPDFVAGLHQAITDGCSPKGGQQVFEVWWHGTNQHP